MVSFGDLLVLIGMFALRFGAPLLIVVGLGYFLKRIDRRWEAEARAQQEAEAGERQGEAARRPTTRPTAPRPAGRPATPKRAPLPELPFVPQPMMVKGAESRAPLGALAFQSGKRCYDYCDCPESQRSQCAAAGQPNLPCWQARFDADGRMPEECADCEMFRVYPPM